MSIENDLKKLAGAAERIADALEKFTGGAPAPAPAKQDKAPAKAPAKEPDPAPPPPAAEEPVKAPAEITRDVLKAKLTEVTAAEGLGRDAVVALFQRFGVPNLKGLPEDKFAAAYAMGDKALQEGIQVITGGGE